MKDEDESVLGQIMRTVGLLIIPQILVGTLPWWYYAFRIDMGYEERMPMRLIDVVTFIVLALCAWLTWRRSRATTRRILRVGLLLLLASSVFLCAVVAWAFIFVPYVPAHFPPWTTGTTLATTLDIVAPLIAVVVAVSFGATLIHVFLTRNCVA